MNLEVGRHDSKHVPKVLANDPDADRLAVAERTDQAKQPLVNSYPTSFLRNSLCGLISRDPKHGVGA